MRTEFSIMPRLRFRDSSFDLHNQASERDARGAMVTLTSRDHAQLDPSTLLELKDDSASERRALRPANGAYVESRITHSVVFSRGDR